MSFLKTKLDLLRDKGIVDLTEAALLTSQSVQTLRRRIKEGRINAIQYTERGKWYIKVEDLNRFIGGHYGK